MSEEQNQPSDRSLLRRLRGGQQDAATQLYYRYAERLRALIRARCSDQLARRLEPDDVVQSVFRRFFRQVMRGAYDVPPGEELWGLLLVIALNRLRSEEAYHRADKRDVGATTTADDLDQSADTAGRARGESDAYLDLVVRDALEQLPEPLREAVELRLQGYEVREIAECTGRPLRSVERLLQEARAKLKSLLNS